MEFTIPTAQIFVPDGAPVAEALARTTHVGICAHPDDLEIMAMGGILSCFRQPNRWFTGVVVTSGQGSPRAGVYAKYTDEEMRAVRAAEQKKAAMAGEYSAVALLDFPSAVVRDKNSREPVEDLARILRAARPEAVYMHNLADKHESHVATALKTLEALRSLPRADRPKACYGVEIWRDLDWLLDEDKIKMDVSEHPNLQTALLGVFDSQVTGGKRYDLAAMGRRRANATFLSPHAVDREEGVSFGMDLTPLVLDESLDIGEFVKTLIDRFAARVLSLLE